MSSPVNQSPGSLAVSGLMRLIRMRDGPLRPEQMQDLESKLQAVDDPQLCRMLAISLMPFDDVQSSIDAIKDQKRLDDAQMADVEFLFRGDLTMSENHEDADIASKKKSERPERASVNESNGVQAPLAPQTQMSFLKERNKKPVTKQAETQASRSQPESPAKEQSKKLEAERQAKARHSSEGVVDTSEDLEEASDLSEDLQNMFNRELNLLAGSDPESEPPEDSDPALDPEEPSDSEYDEDELEHIALARKGQREKKRTLRKERKKRCVDPARPSHQPRGFTKRGGLKKIRRDGEN